VPGPLFASGVLAPLIVWEAGTSEQRSRFLPPLCDGSTICSVALSDSANGWDTSTVTVTATADGDEYVLSGRKCFVHDVNAANWLLCAAQSPDGTILVLIDIEHEGISVHAHEGLLVSLFDIELTSVRVPKERVLTGVPDVWRAAEAAVERAIPVLAAFQVGAGQRVFEMTTAYVNERVVFGQPIGRFQRVQDHCVELVNHLDTARWITYETLWKMDTGLPTKAAVHETKAVVSEAYYQACNAAHKVFAGPGTALDHPLVPHTITSRMLYQYLGDPKYHKDQMIKALMGEV
jgi:alkylation response protein AidB-like acyl-CoA dehydrogenase